MSADSTVKTAVVGGSGYSGQELVRLLLAHPRAELAAIGSSSRAGEPLGKALPAFAGKSRLAFVELQEIKREKFDVVFFAAPEGIASDMAREILESGGVVIDIGPDFRLKDPEEWSRWYGMDHKAPELLGEAVYGLTEFVREEIANARIIACPGCYPTAALLAVYPLLKAGAVKPDPIVVDAKSGATGAGRKTGHAELLFAELNGNMYAYKASGHRHVPEMLQLLQTVSPSCPELTFVPHMVPMSRGLLATVYVQAADSADLHSLLHGCYADEPFVHVEDSGTMPAVANVRHTNSCRIGVHQPNAGAAVISAAIDNLGKGAAGQAVQNMNVRFGFNEDDGLRAFPF